MVNVKKNVHHGQQLQFYYVLSSSFPALPVFLSPHETYVNSCPPERGDQLQWNTTPFKIKETVIFIFCEIQDICMYFKSLWADLHISSKAFL